MRCVYVRVSVVKQEEACINLTVQAESDNVPFQQNVIELCRRGRLCSRCRMMRRGCDIETMPVGWSIEKTCAFGKLVPVPPSMDPSGTSCWW